MIFGLAGHGIRSVDEELGTNGRCHAGSEGIIIFSVLVLLYNYVPVDVSGKRKAILIE